MEPYQTQFLPIPVPKNPGETLLVHSQPKINPDSLPFLTKVDDSSNIYLPFINNTRGPLPLGVERLGSFRHPSPVVGFVLHRLGISLPSRGLCGKHRLPPLGYTPNKLIEKKKNSGVKEVKQRTLLRTFESLHFETVNAIHTPSERPPLEIKNDLLPKNDDVQSKENSSRTERLT